MLTKLCKCGKKILITQSSCAECKSKQQQAYDKHGRSNANVYKDKRWKKLIMMCKSRANGIDLYHYHKTGRIIKGTLAHHIIEVSDDMSKAFDLHNLFWLSDKSHKEVHAIYNKSLKDKQELQGVLFNLIKELTGVY